MALSFRPKTHSPPLFCASQEYQAFIANLLQHTVVFVCLRVGGAFEDNGTKRPRWALSPPYAYILRDSDTVIAILAPQAVP